MSDRFMHYMRAIQGHPGGNKVKVDPLLLGKVKIPYDWSEYTSITLVLLWTTNSILHSRESYD